jgi:hypothetical protein
MVGVMMVEVPLLVELMVVAAVAVAVPVALDLMVRERHYLVALVVQVFSCHQHLEIQHLRLEHLDQRVRQHQMDMIPLVNIGLPVVVEVEPGDMQVHKNKQVEVELLMETHMLVQQWELSNNNRNHHLLML